MSLEVSARAELMPVVWQRLTANGTIKRMMQHIKMAIAAAVGELRGTTLGRSAFDAPFKPTHEAEFGELQSIYQYLEEHDLTSTLECLKEETQVQKDTEAFDLIKIMNLDEAQAEGEEEGDDPE
jgi:hypothetical protein